jgi:hypothetical protein
VIGFGCLNKLLVLSRRIFNNHTQIDLAIDVLRAHLKWGAPIRLLGRDILFVVTEFLGTGSQMSLLLIIDAI